MTNRDTAKLAFRLLGAYEVVTAAANTPLLLFSSSYSAFGFSFAALLQSLLFTSPALWYILAGVWIFWKAGMLARWTFPEETQAENGPVALNADGLATVLFGAAGAYLIVSASTGLLSSVAHLFQQPLAGSSIAIAGPEHNLIEAARNLAKTLFGLILFCRTAWFVTFWRRINEKMDL